MLREVNLKRMKGDVNYYGNIDPFQLVSARFQYAETLSQDSNHSCECYRHLNLDHVVLSYPFTFAVKTLPRVYSVS